MKTIPPDAMAITALCVWIVIAFVLYSTWTS
jgi:hypothetical protein